MKKNKPTTIKRIPIIILPTFLTLKELPIYVISFINKRSIISLLSPETRIFLN